MMTDGRETAAQIHLRENAGFPGVEQDLRSIGRTSTAKAAQEQSDAHGGKDIHEAVIQLQKGGNPVPISSPDEEVWLFDNTAWSTGNNTWSAEFVAAFFSRNRTRDVAAEANKLMRIMELPPTPAAFSTIAARLMPFLNAVLPNRSVEITGSLPDDPLLRGQNRRLGPSDKDGVSVNTFGFNGRYESGDAAFSEADCPARSISSQTYMMPPTGWAIISDIDDTIKVTLTDRPLGILRTTFTEPPTPIAGMPELYRHVVAVLDAPAFWYLSASPYTLYPFLRGFRQQHYPPGPLLLNDASWMDLSGFLASLTLGTKGYKVDQMHKIHDRFPQRMFICFGDSTQTDPESYATLYREHPGWIKKIFIRKVENVREVTDILWISQQKRNSVERFRKAFEGVPEDIWHVFMDPSEIYPVIDGLAMRET